MSIKKRGGKRVGAGRHKVNSGNKKESFVIRLDIVFKELIEKLKKCHQESQVNDDKLKKILSIINNEYQQTTALSHNEQQNIIDALNNRVTELEANNEQPESVEILLAENKRLRELNKDNRLIELNKKYNDEHKQRMDWESKAKLLDSDKRALTTKIKRLEHLEHDCQCLTKSGERCTKKGKLKANYNGIELNVCLQHKKSLESNEKTKLILIT